MFESKEKTRKRKDQLEEKLHPAAKRRKLKYKDHDKASAFSPLQVCEGIIEKLFEDVIQNIIDAVVKNKIKEVLSLL